MAPPWMFGGSGGYSRRVVAPRPPRRLGDMAQFRLANASIMDVTDNLIRRGVEPRTAATVLNMVRRDVIEGIGNRNSINPRVGPPATGSRLARRQYAAARRRNFR